MAAFAAARSAFRSSSARSAAAKFASAAKPAPSPSASAFRAPAGKNPISSRIFRSPVELSACLETMQPFHTATASALMTSKLSISPCCFGWIIDACNDDV